MEREIRIGAKYNNFYRHGPRTQKGYKLMQISTWRFSVVIL